MTSETQRINISIRGCSPCKGCPERFTACSDRCPKDERGEYGYKAWKAKVERVKEVRNEYAKTRYEDITRDLRNNRSWKGWHG
jgi:hypothetical protein